MHTFHCLVQNGHFMYNVHLVRNSEMKPGLAVYMLQGISVTNSGGLWASGCSREWDRAVSDNHLHIYCLLPVQ